MERLLDPREHPFAEITFVGIAIKAIDEKHRHTGILYRDHRTSQMVFLHLAFHRKLIAAPPNPTYFWIDPKFSARRLRHLAAKCRQIWDENGCHIPFGFSTPNECFDSETLRFLIGPSKIGLTCATFVLAAFEVTGLKLLQWETWKDRKDDVEWQRHVVEELKNEEAAASAEHIRAVESSIGAIRVRPEEVAAAGTIAPPAPNFDETVKRAEGVLAIITPGIS